MTNRTDIERETIVNVLVVPLFLGLILYITAALCVWPYARPIFPFGLLLLFIIFPPFFPFFLIYMLLFVFWPVPLSTSNVVVGYPTATVGIVEPSTRGRIRPIATSTFGNRV
jgi:hypothetical protein